MKIPYSDLTVNNDIVYENGLIIKPIDGLYKVKIAGVDKEVNLSWLVGFSLINVVDNEYLSKVINELYFVSGDNKYNYTFNGLVALFKNPIECGEYRLLPFNTDYAINNSGSLIRLSDNFIQNEININEYYRLSIVGTPDVNRHVAVSLVWCDNDDYLTKPIVNHKDGIKHNCNYDNLEWCSYSHNSNHAFASGLREDNIPVKCRSVKTGVVSNFQSIAALSKFLGYKVDSLRLHNILGNKRKLFNREYEVKLAEDDSCWNHAHDTPGRTNNEYTVIVTRGKLVKEYTHVNDFIKGEKLWNISASIPVLANVLRERDKHITVDIIDHKCRLPVIALEIDSGKIYKASTASGLGSLLGIHRSKVAAQLHRAANIEYRGYLIKYDDGKPWPSNIIFDRCKPMTVKATNDNDVVIFESLTSAANYFDVDRSVIKSRIGLSKDYNGWVFSQ